MTHFKDGMNHDVPAKVIEVNYINKCDGFRKLQDS